MISNHERPNLLAAYEAALQFILEQGIHSLPVEPFSICEKNGWKLIPVNEFCAQRGYDPELMLSSVIMSDYGAAIHTVANNSYCIVYNDKHDDETIRWIICHEIAHIILGHFNSTAHIISKGVLSPDEYVRCEQEAEWFTRTLFAPPPVLAAIGSTKSTQISELCAISDECAGRAMLFLRGPWGIMEKNLDLERKVLRQFSEFIRNKKKR